MDQLGERTIILHYHLFKNAGTSLDRILQKNFPGRWVTREFPRNAGDNSAMVAEWIAATPEAVAFSSHTMLGPVPQVDGVRILSVLFLRDPVARIVSAYNFERKQDADTVGARLAKENDLEGYVRARLAIPGDRQCRNFQVNRLASMVPGDTPELDRAKQALDLLTFIGRVETFAESMARFEAVVRADFPDFAAQVVHANVSEKAETALADEVAQLLEQNNRADRALLQVLDRRGRAAAGH